MEGQDENNQYGHKQTKKLMIGGFKLHTGSKDKLYNEVYDILQNYEEDGDKSYLFMVDLYYPGHLHG